MLNCHHKQLKETSAKISQIKYISLKAGGEWYVPNTEFQLMRSRVLYGLKLADEEKPCLLSIDDVIEVLSTGWGRVLHWCLSFGDSCLSSVISSNNTPTDDPFHGTWGRVSPNSSWSSGFIVEDGHVFCLSRLQAVLQLLQAVYLITHMH